MKIVIQRVRKASVSVDEQIVGQIQQGFVVLVGIAEADCEADIAYLVRKLVSLRIFSDEQGKMNLSIKDVGGSVLSISQFTLLADTKKGNRPSFIHAAQPQKARAYYEQFNQLLKTEGIIVETGVFGADMQVSLVNDGPVTIIYDTTA